MNSLRAALAATVTVVLGLTTATPAAAAPGGWVRVSLSSTGQPGNGPVHSAAMSGTGRFVAFVSEASDLVPGDTNGRWDVFLRDRLRATTVRISVSGSGEQADRDTYGGLAISHDGRFVAFTSEASNLVPDDTNAVADVFLHDRRRGTLSRVSVSATGAQAEGQSAVGAGTISDDGRYVAFTSRAENLVPGDTNQSGDVFVRDRRAGTTERVSVSTAGEQAAYDLHEPPARISADGRYVAFVSMAPNLSPGDGAVDEDVYVRDRRLGTTTLITRTPAGARADDRSIDLTMTPDGRFLGIMSRASNLVPGDTNGAYDQFVVDRHTGVFERVSVTGAEEQLERDTYGLALSADGRYAVMSSDADNLVPGQPLEWGQIIVRDRAAGTTRLVRRGIDGEPGDSYSYEPMITRDGRLVACISRAGNLVAGDTDDREDVYVTRLRPGA